MAAPNQQDFTSNLFKLLHETFEGRPAGGGGFYLDQGAGLFETLETIDAEVASRAPWPGAPSIAAHSAHLGYYVRANHNAIIGRAQELNWPASWHVQRVGPEEWQALKVALRREYDELGKALRALPAWEDAAAADGMAIVAHTAYHLGAIRQIRRLLQVESNLPFAPPERQPH